MLHVLPTDQLKQILYKVDVQDLCRVETVSRYLRNVCAAERDDIWEQAAVRDYGRLLALSARQSPEITSFKRATQLLQTTLPTIDGLLEKARRSARHRGSHVLNDFLDVVAAADGIAKQHHLDISDRKRKLADESAQFVEEKQSFLGLRFHLSPDDAKRAEVWEWMTGTHLSDAKMGEFRRCLYRPEGFIYEQMCYFKRPEEKGSHRYIDILGLTVS